MRCYRHSDQEASAICKHCTRGLCAACIVETPGGTACGEQCAAEIAFVRKVMRRSGRSIALQSEAPRFLAVFLMLTGLGFIVHGALESSSRSQLFLIGAGVVFSLFGIGIYRLWRRYRDSDA